MLVEDFEPAPRDHPWAYPGSRPARSYLLSGNEVSLMEPQKGDLGDMFVDNRTLDERLDDVGAEPLSNRYAIVGYGSNANPAQLCKKFSDTTIPVIRGELHDYDVTYACSIAPYGSIPATLSFCPNVLSEVWVTYLDDDQFGMMDESESRNKSYKLVKLPSIVKLEGGYDCKPVAYIHMNGAQEGPIRLREIPARNASFYPMSQQKMMRMVARKLGIEKDVLVENPLDYRDTMTSWPAIHDDRGEILHGSTRPEKVQGCRW